MGGHVGRVFQEVSVAHNRYVTKSYVCQKRATYVKKELYNRARLYDQTKKEAIPRKATC